MKVPGRFLDAIGADPGNCVLVVGSGLSKRGVRKHRRGLPDWDELMGLMIRHLEETERCTRPELDQLRAMLAATPPAYLEIAQRFREAHAHDLDGYERFLRRHLRPPDLVESRVHRLILAIGFRGIVSYNFDLVFERQPGGLDRIVYPTLMDQIGRFQRRGFFAKVHGCIDGPATQLVLTRDDYGRLSNHPNFGRLLEVIFSAHKTLCAGFSLQDPDFLRTLDDLRSHWGSSFPPIFALMRDPGQGARSAWLERGVDILPYARHQEVAGFLKRLADLPASRQHQGHVATGRTGRSRASRDRSRPPRLVGTAAVEATTGQGWEDRIRKALDKKVTFDFVETPLPDVLNFLSSLWDVTIVLDTAAVRDAPSVTLRVNEMRGHLALKWMLKLVGLHYTLIDEAIFVIPGRSDASVSVMCDAGVAPGESATAHASQAVGGFSEDELRVLRCVRTSPHSVSLQRISHATNLSLPNTAEVIRDLLSRKCLRQDRRVQVVWNDQRARFSTEPSKRRAIDAELHP